MGRTLLAVIQNLVALGELPATLPPAGFRLLNRKDRLSHNIKHKAVIPAFLLHKWWYSDSTGVQPHPTITSMLLHTITAQRTSDLQEVHAVTIGSDSCTLHGGDTNHDSIQTHVPITLTDLLVEGHLPTILPVSPIGS